MDYFALLDQPRAPWLDPDKLKEAYHRKTLAQHPDTDLNQAYQVLRDSKRRLQHLLRLEGHEPSATDQSLPKPLHDLFPLLGELTNNHRLLLERVRTASTALGRALLKPHLLDARNKSEELRDTIQRLSNAAEAQLQEINAAWPQASSQQLGALSNLYLTFAYLSRWSAQVDEMIFQLSVCDS